MQESSEYITAVSNSNIVSLSSLSASIVTLNANIVTLNSTLGSLSAKVLHSSLSASATGV